MANLAKIAKGTGIFFISFFLMYLLNRILPPILTSLETIFATNTDLQGIIWFGTIIIWISTVIGLPSFFIITGLREDDGMSKPMNLMAGIFIFIFGILLTIIGWNWITTFSNIFVGETGAALMLVIYWIGLLAIWIEIVIVTPVYLVIQGTQA